MNLPGKLPIPGDPQLAMVVRNYNLLLDYVRSIRPMESATVRPEVTVNGTTQHVKPSQDVSATTTTATGRWL